VGDYNFPNIMTAIAIGSHFGIPLDAISDAIAGYSPDNSRSQWLQRGTNKVILDAYNANPTSMRAAIGNFAAAALPNKMLWLGAMKEMGAEEHNEHKSLIEFISQYSWTHVILVGKEFAGIDSPYMNFDTSAEAAEYIKAHLPSDASILIKGSRGSKMEVLLDVL
jgi:UDP-N-acetylmuramoyl-tripeptide--D-alanyl-D-alanine ligase